MWLCAGECERSCGSSRRTCCALSLALDISIQRQLALLEDVSVTNLDAAEEIVVWRNSLGGMAISWIIERVWGLLGLPFLEDLVEFEGTRG